MSMDYTDPYEKSERDVDTLSNFIWQLLDLNQIKRADEYYETAIDLRTDAQAELVDLLNEDDFDVDENREILALQLGLWHGSGYLIQLLGEYGICKHELKRYDCGICSRNVIVKRE